MSVDDHRIDALDAALTRIQGLGDAAALQPEEISFGLLPFNLDDRWDEALARLRSLLEAFTRAAAAESAADSGLQARSVLSWTGDLSTVWSGPVSPPDRRAHFEKLDAGVRYRARLILIVTASLAAAATMCAAASSPLLLPAAYRSLTRLVAELQGLAPGSASL